MSSDPASGPAHAPAAKKYLPGQERQGSALCLSGGGYRAALFHLGSCRRLNEVGILSGLDAISSVSGGSIFSAHLAYSLIEHGADAFDHFEALVAAPFRRFVKNNIRTSPALARLLPWEWINAGAGAEALIDQYEKHLLGGKGLTISQLPDSPRFVFCATDIVFGVSWVFSKDRVGDFQAGYMRPGHGGEQLIAKAVAASSCFPPIFKPLPLALQPDDLSGGDFMDGDERSRFIQSLALCDGGVYDNMGLEPVWKDFANVIVSDGGKPFSFAKEPDAAQQLLRMHDVVANQAEALRKRWLIASYLRGDYHGTYFGIKNAVSDYVVNAGVGYSKALATNTISQIRTDMDEFSDDEIAVLENHGYTLADAAFRSHIAVSNDSVAPLAPLANNWWPTPPGRLPQLESRLSAALSGSSQIRLLGHHA